MWEGTAQHAGVSVRAGGGARVAAQAVWQGSCLPACLLELSPPPPHAPPGPAPQRQQHSQSDTRSLPNVRFHCTELESPMAGKGGDAWLPSARTAPVIHSVTCMGARQCWEVGFDTSSRRKVRQFPAAVHALAAAQRRAHRFVALLGGRNKLKAKQAMPPPTPPPPPHPHPPRRSGAAGRT